MAARKREKKPEEAKQVGLPLEEKKVEVTEVVETLPFKVAGRASSSEGKLRQGFASPQLRPYAAAAGRRGQEARKRRMEELRKAGAAKVWTGGFKPGEAYTREMAKFAINERWRKYYAEKAKRLEKDLKFDRQQVDANLEAARAKIATEIVPAKNEAKYMAASIARAGSEARRVTSLIDRLVLRAEQIKQEAATAPKGVLSIPSEGRPPIPALPGESRKDLEKREMQFRTPLTEQERLEVQRRMKEQQETREYLAKLRAEGKYIPVVEPPKPKREAIPQTEEAVQAAVALSREGRLETAPAETAPSPAVHNENVGGVAVTVVETKPEPKTETAPEPKKELSREELKRLKAKLSEQVEEELYKKSKRFGASPRATRQKEVAVEVERLLWEQYGIKPTSGSGAEVSESSSQGAWMAAAALIALVPSLGSISAFARMLEARADAYRAGVLDPMVLSVDIASSPRVQRALYLARRRVGLA